MSPISLPEPALEQDVRLALAENRASAASANARLRQSRAWYEALRTMDAARSP